MAMSKAAWIRNLVSMRESTIKALLLTTDPAEVARHQAMAADLEDSIRLARKTAVEVKRED